MAVDVTGDQTLLLLTVAWPMVFCFFLQTGFCSVHAKAGRSRTFPTVAESGAGLCAAHAGREDGVYRFDLRRPPHCPGTSLFLQ